MIDTHLVQVWHVTVEGRPLRVATVEQGPPQPSMCNGCPAPCCRGPLAPILTREEFHERHFPARIDAPPDWMREKVPRAEGVAVLDVNKHMGCPLFDAATARCTVWPDPPKACLAYDCREDTRPEIAAFAHERARTWKETA